MSNILFLLPLLALLAAPARAEEAAPRPSFIFPLACALGEECWPVNYMDNDAAAREAKDFTCGPLTYDSHDGTDFGVRDRITMADGISVLAAAPGTVVRVRDGAEDLTPSAEEVKQMLTDRKGCGNGVLVDHGGGWETIYCHIKKGSITVKAGQAVRAGETLGLVGQSGAAEFPHLHFGVLKDKTLIDPYTGNEAGTCDTPPAGSLWWPDLKMEYRPVSLYAVGFAATVPDFKAIEQNAASPPELSATHLDALTFWTALYGAATGDKIRTEIIGPDGSIFAARDTNQDKNRARQYYYVGKKITLGTLPPGLYTGRTTLTRPGADETAAPIVRTIEKTLTVNP